MLAPQRHRVAPCGSLALCGSMDGAAGCRSLWAADEYRVYTRLLYDDLVQGIECSILVVFVLFLRLRALVVDKVGGMWHGVDTSARAVDVVVVFGESLFFCCVCARV